MPFDTPFDNLTGIQNPFGDPHAFGDNIYASLFIERVL